MIRLTAVALAALLVAPTAFAQSGGMSRPGSTDSSDTTTTTTERDAPTPQTGSDGSVADVADGLGIDTGACSEYLTPAHRDIVELRYITEALPAGSLKREFAGRLDKMESDTASALGSLCGVRNLDRTPPSTFQALDIASVAGAAGSVFGNDIEVNENGFVLKAAEAVLEAVTGGSRRDRRRAARASADADASMARRSGTTVGDDGISSIIADIEAAPFADDKIAALEMGVAGKSFTSAQVAQLVKAMPFAEQRIPVALFLQPTTTDPANFQREVSAVLPFASERTQLREALAAQAAQ